MDRIADMAKTPPQPSPPGGGSYSRHLMKPGNETRMARHITPSPLWGGLGKGFSWLLPEQSQLQTARHIDPLSLVGIGEGSAFATRDPAP
jgi:hypothetical protein